MRVKLNGVEREVSGRTLGEILSGAGVEYSEGCAIAIVSERKKEEVAREFILRTPKGMLALNSTLKRKAHAPQQKAVWKSRIFVATQAEWLGRARMSSQ